MNSDKQNSFNYSYSARENEELKRIREKYSDSALSEKKTDKAERIRQLDKTVSRKAADISLSLGIISTLVLGFGMSLIMTDINMILGELSELYLLFGILIGLVGIIGIIFAYPLYHAVLKRERKKAAPEMLRLTDELIGEGND